MMPRDRGWGYERGLPLDDGAIICSSCNTNADSVLASISISADGPFGVSPGGGGGVGVGGGGGGGGGVGAGVGTDLTSGCDPSHRTSPGLICPLLLITMSALPVPFRSMARLAPPVLASRLSTASPARPLNRPVNTPARTPAAFNAPETSILSVPLVKSSIRSGLCAAESLTLS